MPDAHLTERQRLAIQSQKAKEEEKKRKEEELKREEALDEEQRLVERIGELQKSCGIGFLGRDRAYRRFWALETLPGLFVEHDDDTVGPCLEEPTRVDPDAGPMDEGAAIKKVAEILDSRDRQAKKGSDSNEKSSSDKENDQADDKKVLDVTKTYSRKEATPSVSSASSSVLKQKVLSAKNGALDVSGPSSEIKAESKVADSEVVILDGPEEKPILTEDLKSSPISAPWGACLADQVNCPVHSTILPRTYWSYYSSEEELDRLIETLNPRGFRESELRERLLGEKDKLAKNFRKFGNLDIESKLNREQKEEDPSTAATSTTAGESSVASSADLQLRDQILELEEKVYLGTLGTLKVRDRTIWQKAIQDGGYDRQCDSIAWGGKSVQDTPFESRMQSAGASRDQVGIAADDDIANRF